MSQNHPSGGGRGDSRRGGIPAGSGCDCASRKVRPTTVGSVCVRAVYGRRPSACRSVRCCGKEKRKMSKMSKMSHEYETTCAIFFDGDSYRRVKAALYDKCRGRPAEETVDVYPDPLDNDARYRTLVRYAECCSDDDVRVAHRRLDHKKTLRAYESQVPHMDRVSRRVVFVTCTYTECVERRLTETEWNDTVKEDHASGRYARSHNKRRTCFFRDAFAAEFPFTRVSVGERSTYGGTLETRTTCDSIYYLEIEHEVDSRLDRPTDVRKSMRDAVELLFRLLPYDLVRTAMSAANTCSVQRERLDSVFDTFKRRFRDYNGCAAALRREGRRDRLNFFVMPKWDGVRAMGLYYREGQLIVKDACGRMSSLLTDLPFDNDMVFQLEAVRPKSGGERRGTDSSGRYYVITELMAVLVKTPNTIFQVYGRNNAKHDTGRNIGNVATSIAIKAQFSDSSHVCGLYRRLPAETSLRVLSVLTKAESLRRPPPAAAFRMVTLTSVVNLTDGGRGPKSREDVLRCLDAAHDGESGGEKERLAAFTETLPRHLRDDARFDDDCEGLIVAYTDSEDVGGGGGGGGGDATSDHGYFKLKLVDTVDLQLNLETGRLTSSDLTEYAAEGLPTLDGAAGWEERPVPILNRRVIAECYYDGVRLRFSKDRPDKTRPDSDRKINATRPEIFARCKVNG